LPLNNFLRQTFITIFLFKIWNQIDKFVITHTPSLVLNLVFGLNFPLLFASFCHDIQINTTQYSPRYSPICSHFRHLNQNFFIHLPPLWVLFIITQRIVFFWLIYNRLVFNIALHIDYNPYSFIIFFFSQNNPNHDQIRVLILFSH
jgi:hypothetical protein